MLCLSAILNDIMVERVEMTIKRRHCLMASSSVLTKVLTTMRDLTVSLFPDTGRDGVDSKMHRPALQWNHFIRLNHVS